MLSLFRFLLHLYPAAYQAEFAEEMLDVLEQSSSAIPRDRFREILKFYAREITGLVAGACEERVRLLTGLYPALPQPRRFTMRSTFRFPKSLAPMMLLVFALVMFTIIRAASTAVIVSSPHTVDASEKLSLPLSVGLWMGLAYLVGAIVWILIHSLHRSGSERLSNVQTWPQK